MQRVNLHKVTLGSVRLPRVAFGDRKGGEPKPPTPIGSYMLLEDGGFMLTEDGGAILLESGVKQIKLREEGA